MKDFIDLSELTREEIDDILDSAVLLKEQRHADFKPLAGKRVALYFEKPSLRTRVSFEIGIQELGGSVTVLDKSSVAMGHREPVQDVARTLERYVDAVVCRLFEHRYLHELSRWSRLHVINALTDFSHPCQILADVQTLKEAARWHDELTLVWVGDPNNVLQSWIELALHYPIRIVICSPALPMTFEPWLFHPVLRNRFCWIKEPAKAVADADVLYADTWISMGQEPEAEQRRAYFRGYTISQDLLRHAPPHALVMHCLPAKRGEEIEDDVLEAFSTLIFNQAENRLHVQKAILWKLLSPELRPSRLTADAIHQTLETV